MKSLHDLDIFVRAIDGGSLSAAARALNLTPAAASAALKRLETDLGVQLVVRSTRSLRLTGSGETLLEQCRPALAVLHQVSQQLSVGDQALRGELKLSAPSDFGRNLLLPWLDAFQDRHPHVQVRLQLSDRLANVFSEPVDAAFRYGEPSDSSVVALPLAPDNRRVLCASPAYLARRGRPATPHDLPDHDCLCFMLSDAVHDRWRFSRDAGPDMIIKVRGARIADDGDVVRRWALAGHGVAYKARFDVAADIATGRLITLCAEWTTEAAPMYLVVPTRRQLTPLVRCLRDFVAERTAAI